MQKNTDENGRLILVDVAPMYDDSGRMINLAKCRMAWDNPEFETILFQLDDICFALEYLGNYYKEHDVEFGSCPLFGDDTDEYEEDVIINVWRTFFEGSDKVGEEIEDRIPFAEERLGVKNGVLSYNAFILAHRYCRVVAIGAPGIITEHEFRSFVQFMVLAFACEEYTVVDILHEKYNRETDSLGAFDKDDLSCVFRMLNEDSSLLPEVSMGYCLLVNKIFGKYRLDLCREEALKAAFEHVLGTILPSERRVVELAYGLNDGKRRSINEIAFETGRTPQRIEIIIITAIRKLRHPSRTRVIKPFVE